MLIGFMKEKHFNLLLYILIGLTPTLTLIVTGDDIKIYFSAKTIFLLKSSFAILAAMVGSAKAYMSMSWAGPQNLPATVPVENQEQKTK
jgi:hypothetical protein